MSNLGQREPQPAGLTHERQQPQHVRVVVSVAGRRAPWRLENPSCFVQPERLAAEAAARRDLPEEQSVARHKGSIALTPRGKVKGALYGVQPHLLLLEVAGGALRGGVGQLNPGGNGDNLYGEGPVTSPHRRERGHWCGRPM